ncbi:hypothetical protein [Crocosphaera watsonii]|uniref:Uncharacterized protein n=1 Tax=Crocosphaera watsonii WH 8502 TaxID=423474 RepID=T2IJ87_CROWT|nr:hypothetical protein [Crocosphaera watsonii]CCQ52260.1 FIG00563082: hypothetical protein [Crocosphaera watsonii WH 8502]
MAAANLSRFRLLKKRRNFYQSRRQVLRSQLGFNQVESTRPKTCLCCCHYHGKFYGYNREQRSQLICGFHPSGWLKSEQCPDWEEISDS